MILFLLVQPQKFAEDKLASPPSPFAFAGSDTHTGIIALSHLFEDAVLGAATFLKTS